MKNKSKTGITYEELMNSRFIEFPAHNAFLFNLLQPIVLCSIIIVGSIIAAIAYNVNATLAALVIVLAVMIQIRMQGMYYRMSGHGVGLRPKPKFSIMRLSTRLSITIIVVVFFTSFLLLLTLLGNWDSAQEAVQYHYFGSVFFSSGILSMLSWKYHFYYATWYGDEYKARTEFINSGMNTIQIQDNIDQLKRIGILSRRK
ncbi:MAG: hypothetical protein KA028_03685 [Candidatus Pacebacteria bacterium]|nr:hypothetical protein [Candidatus Paceibacterota bacterium]